jgi:hypothetical protein
VYVFGVLEFDNPEPVVINGLNGENEYKLKFNCKPCEMEIWEKDADLEFIDEDEQLLK